jgi:hypothetical protein
MSSITSIRLGFLESDDRLLLDFVCSDETRPLLVTRRIARRMIQGLAKMLANPNPAMARVPDSHKTEMLIWEHLTALTPAGAGGDDAAAGVPPRRPAPWPLLTRLDLNAHDNVFRLRFEASDHGAVAVDMTREELHRLLANLRQLARHAEWDLDAEVGWLVEADSPTLMRPGSLAS